MIKKIYFIGIGGIAMANLACLFKTRGSSISGSDLDTFGPSAELLKKHKINYSQIHDPTHLKKFKPDIVVIGNIIKENNPSVKYVLEKQIPYQSLPEIVKSEIIKDNKSIVVTGTSGKTTTTALIVWILHKAGLKPTALFGGIAKNFDSGFLTLPRGKDFGEFEGIDSSYVVVEGDEYGSSFNDFSPKFMHYSPHIAVVNNIQSDHLDIFGNIQKIIKTFQKLPPLIPRDGLLVLNAEDKNSQSLRKLTKSKVETFGQNGTVFAKNIKLMSDGLGFELFCRNEKLGEIKTGLLGRHNIENILAASTIALNIGISFKNLAEAIKTFKGVKRRLEIIYPARSLARVKNASPKNLDKNTSGGITIIDDFAHNPDKVSSSLKTLREHFPKHKIVAIFEPRTGSSRRKFFQKAYIPSFKLADLVYISEPYKKELLNKKESFSSHQLAEDLNKQGTKTYCLTNADAIIKHLIKYSVRSRLVRSSASNKPALIIIMTSGNFDGIHKKLINVFSK